MARSGTTTLLCWALCTSAITACAAIEEASLGERVPDAGTSEADAFTPLPDAGDAASTTDAGAEIDASPAAIEPSPDAQPADAGIAPAANEVPDASDASARAQDSGSARDAARDARASLECRFEPWECR